MPQTSLLHAFRRGDLAKARECLKRGLKFREAINIWAEKPHPSVAHDDAGWADFLGELLPHCFQAVAATDRPWQMAIRMARREAPLSAQRLISWGIKGAQAHPGLETHARETLHRLVEIDQATLLMFVLDHLPDERDMNLSTVWLRAAARVKSDTFEALTHASRYREADIKEALSQLLSMELPTTTQKRALQRLTALTKPSLGDLLLATDRDDVSALEVLRQSEVNHRISPPWLLQMSRAAARENKAKSFAWIWKQLTPQEQREGTAVQRCLTTAIGNGSLDVIQHMLAHELGDAAIQRGLVKVTQALDTTDSALPQHGVYREIYDTLFKAAGWTETVQTLFAEDLDLFSPWLTSEQRQVALQQHGAGNLPRMASAERHTWLTQQPSRSSLPRRLRG